MSRIPFLIPTLLLLPGLCSAATLTGYLLDAREQPLPSVGLAIVHVLSRQHIDVCTDASGRFNVELEAGDYAVFLSGSDSKSALAVVRLAVDENREVIMHIPANGKAGSPADPGIESPDRYGAAAERSLAGIRDYQVLREARDTAKVRRTDSMAQVVNPFPAQRRGRVHGSVYEFHRNDNFDARNFFDPIGKPLPEYKRNEFGLVLGANISKDLKLLGTYEGLRIVQGSTLLSHVPTAEMKRGDFSAQPVELRDPWSGQPLEGGRIPPGWIHPVATRLLEILPAPNSDDPDRNYVNSQPVLRNRDSLSLRTDYQLRDGSSLFVRYSISDSGSFRVHPLPAFGTHHADREQEADVSYSHRFTSRFLASARLGYDRSSDLFASPNAGNAGLLASIGIAGIEVDDPDLEGYPEFWLSGYAAFGDAGLPVSVVNNRFSFDGSLTWTPRNHSLRVGGGWTAYQVNNASSDALRRGRFSFSGYYSGDAFADFLLGVPDSATRALGSDRSDLRRRSLYAFLRDEFRASPRLTLSGGIVYNYFGPFRSIHRNVSGFVPLLFEPPLGGEIVIAGTARAEELGLAPAGAGGMVYPDRNDWAPSFGIAYRPTGNNRFVVRSAYSIRYNPLGRDYFVNYLGRNYPFYYTESALSPVERPVIDLSDPFAATRLTELGVRGIEATIRNAYIHDWFFGVQGQLREQWYLDSSYEGNKATRMPRVLPSNVPPPAPDEVQPRRPNPEYGRFTILTGGGAYTRHGLDVGVERRLANGYSFRSGFSWTASMNDLYRTYPSNPRDLSAERAGADWMPARRLYFNYVLDLPFGRNGIIARGVGPWLDGLIGGWRLSGITNFRDGTRFSVYQPGDHNNDGISEDRPDRVGPAMLGKSERSVDSWFETSDFVAPAPYSFGNSGRNILVGPSYANWDISVIKQTRVTDGNLIEFRIELFNAFNQVNFEQPYPVLGTSSFGKIFGASRAREIEIALRYSF